MKLRNPFVVIWNYVRNSWEGPDGKFSYKRVTQFVFVQLMVYMIVNGRVSTQWEYFTFLTVAALFAFVARVINPKQAADLMRAAGGLNKNTNEEVTIGPGPDDRLPV